MNSCIFFMLRKLRQSYFVVFVQTDGRHQTGTAQKGAIHIAITVIIIST